MVALAALFLIARGWSLQGVGILELLLLLCLVVLSVWPGIHWYRQGMKWLPLGESFVFLHLIYYVLPCLSGRADLLAYSQTRRLQALMGVGVFEISFLIVYYLILNRPQRQGQSGLLLREMDPRIINVMFGLWIVWSIMLQSHLLPGMGSAFNILRSVVTSMGSVSIIYLFYQIGQRKISEEWGWLVIGGMILGLVLNFASGFLNGAVQWLGAALLAFTLGRKRVPVGAIVVCVLLLDFLQLGKGDFRDAYWGENQNYSNKRIGLIDGYTTWLEASWRNLWHGNGDNGGAQQLTERASLVQVLARAMDVTPRQQPFLNGQTYLMLPELMAPRIFWPDKPRGTLPSETLGIYIGIQTTEGSDITGISIGQVAEAWINFGWPGLALAAACFAVLFGYPARMSHTLLPNQVGWLLSSIFLIYSTNLENSMVEILCSLSTALFMGIALLLVVSQERFISQRLKRRTKQNNSTPTFGGKETSG